MIGLREVQRVALRLAMERGDRLNPKTDRGCVYTSPDDPDDHCYAGQLLVEFGCPLPIDNTPVNNFYHAHRRNFTSAANVFMRHLQRNADVGRAHHRDRFQVTAGETRLPWLTAYELACETQAIDPDVLREID